MSSNVAVVTGAAQGIGLATALHLVSRGWSVVAVDTNLAGLQALAARSPRIAIVDGDITAPGVLKEAGDLADRTGVLAGWVNNAVIMATGRLDEVSLETIERGLAVDLQAVIVGSQVAIQSFLRSGFAGAIVNVSSVHGRVSYPGNAVYDACKGGVESFTRYVCVEYGHRGIRCNALAPGAVVTPEQEADRSPAADDHRRVLESFSPMKALIPTSYYAELIEFLLSDGARFINGHVLAAEGGLLSRCYPFEPDPKMPGRTDQGS